MPYPCLAIIRHTERQVTMKFPYHVTHNGIDYLPNEEVPIEEKAPAKVKEQPVVAEKVVEEKPKYNKTEINRMPIEDLRKLAKSEGIADKSGAEIKKALIEKLGL